MEINSSKIWDVSIPVEKSAYVHERSVQYFNVNKLKVEDGHLTMLDLFCGAGGFAVGCSWAGFQSVLGIDHLRPAMSTWMHNHPNAIGCLGDIKKVNASDIKELLINKGVTKINLITSGVPCQGFSLANRKHNDEDERNFLFIEFMRFVEVFLPDYIILENVSGMRSTAGGRFAKEISENMMRLGYNVTVKLVNAAEYGVPQIRQRLVFVGVKTDSGLQDKYVFPEGTFKQKPRTVEDAISDLPELENNQSTSAYTYDAKSDFQRLMRGEANIAITKADRLHNHISPNHPVETILRIQNTPQGAPMYLRFRQRIRLKLDEPSPTQLAGGIRPQFQFGHPTQPRGLTIRERARIQSFPDSYVFKGGIVQERVQTGNAVPPLLIYELTKSIAEDIKRRDKESHDV